MGTLATSKLIKFLEEDVNFSSQISRSLLNDMASAINGFCDYTEIMCTSLTGTGTYTTKPNASSIIAIGVGGGGGGGGGGNGGFLDFIRVIASMNAPASGGGGGTGPNVYEILSLGTFGSFGSKGGDTIFNGQVVAEGGLGGSGSYFMRPFMDDDANFISNQNLRLGQELVGPAYNEKFRAVKDGCRDSHTIDGLDYGSGGEGASGSPSEILGANLPSTIGNQSWTYGGLNGNCGQTGCLSWVCLENIQPGSSYSYSVGQGGAGGASGPDHSVVFGGITYTKSNGTIGETGEDGGLIIIELGF